LINNKEQGKAYEGPKMGDIRRKETKEKEEMKKVKRPE
jgi:hypothetical protein